MRSSEDGLSTNFFFTFNVWFLNVLVPLPSFTATLCKRSSLLFLSVNNRLCMALLIFVSLKNRLYSYNKDVSKYGEVSI